MKPRVEGRRCVTDVVQERRRDEELSLVAPQKTPADLHCSHRYTLNMSPPPWKLASEIPLGDFVGPAFPEHTTIVRMPATGQAACRR